MFLHEPPNGDAAQALYAEAQSEDGYVPNFLKVWCWRPELHRAFLDMRVSLASQSSLSAREVAVLNATTASRLGDGYCSLAWGTKLAEETSPATAAAVLGRREQLDLSERERALVAWASAIVENPNGTTQAQVDELKRLGFDERTIFDATVIVAFRLAFGSVNDALGATPDPQLAETAPKEVVASISYGRR